MVELQKAFTSIITKYKDSRIFSFVWSYLFSTSNNISAKMLKIIWLFVFKGSLEKYTSALEEKFINSPLMENYGGIYDRLKDFFKFSFFVFVTWCEGALPMFRLL